MAVIWSVLPPASTNQAPSVPGWFGSSSPTNTSITLSWSAATDSDGSVAGYEVRIGVGAAVNVGNVLSHVVSGLTLGTSYDFQVRAYDNLGLRGGWSSAVTQSTTGTAPTSTWDAEVASAAQVFRMEADMFPEGNISKSQYESEPDADIPHNSGHWKITTDRFARKTIPALGKALIQMKDPALTGTKGSTWNPWNRRLAPEINWGADNLVPYQGATPGNYGFTWLELYFPEHSFTGVDDEEGWATSHTIKFLDGWNLGDVGATGQNPQVANDSWEMVFTLYWLLTLQSNNYSLSTKGDFGRWQDGVSTIDTSGLYNPVINLNDKIQMQKEFFLGPAFYAHDTRQTYNYQNMMYLLWPGTNYRIIFPVNAHFELRYFLKLNTPSSSGPYDGRVYFEMKINSWPRALPPVISLNTWFTVRNLVDVDFRGSGTSPVLDTGNGFFAGGGLGDAFMDDDTIYSPTPGYPPRYARNLFYQKRNWAK